MTAQVILADTLNRPLRDLRISVIDTCNFRCPYCMPESEFADYRFLRCEERLSFEEIERLATLFARLGVNKLRLTGGEPLLRKRLDALVGRLATIPGIDDIALTTNGMLLEAQAQALAAAGLRRVTVSLDSVDPEVFSRMSGGRGDLDRVLRGIDAARAAGLDPVKLNVVVQRGVNEDGVLDLVERFRGTGVVVRFIEFMDVGTRNGWNREQVLPSAELLRRIGARWPLSPLPGQYRGETAERYAFDDGGGELGFISSVSQPFCGDCTRARLSTDGALYTCLFGASGTDLRGPMREGAGDAALLELITRIWRGRSDRYSEVRAEIDGQRARKRIEMYQIGG